MRDVGLGWKGFVWLLSTLFFIAAAISLLAGCTPRTVRVHTSELVTPKCDVPNSFEKCVAACMKKGELATDSWEDADSFDCHCAPWDA